ncbi:MAG TPA: efflux RND transporter periplasmic adaptor subunit [Sunxiuqinia sp.]|nr:efflux RND transporter periplasmic adaptor subunit [Sunxiuqinia sp.]
MKMTIKKSNIINQLAAILAVVILASCSSGNAGNDDKSKQAQLTKYKEQVHDLQQKIDALEKDLNSDATVEYKQVVLSPIKPKTFEHFFEVTGNVQADQELNVSPEGSGQIMTINVKEGDIVKKGTVLAVLNSDPIDKSIEQVKINLDLARTTFERQKNLWDQHIGSEMQFLQARSNKEALEKQLENLKAQKDMSIIKAPVDGTIDEIYQKQGQIASAAIPFARLVNIQQIKVYADVAETYLTKIKKGDMATVTFPAINKDVKTKIQMIGNYIDPNNRTFRVRLNLQNKDNLIKPNMDALVKLRDYVAKDAVVVPSILIKEDFKGKYTFIGAKKGDGLMARKVYVTTGVTDNNMTEVTSGLTADMNVISEGFGQVVDGTPIQAN